MNSLNQQKNNATVEKKKGYFFNIFFPEAAPHRAVSSRTIPRTLVAECQGSDLPSVAAEQSAGLSLKAKPEQKEIFEHLIWENRSEHVSTSVSESTAPLWPSGDLL